MCSLILTLQGNVPLVLLYKNTVAVSNYTSLADCASGEQGACCHALCCTKHLHNHQPALELLLPSCCLGSSPPVQTIDPGCPTCCPAVPAPAGGAAAGVLLPAASAAAGGGAKQAQREVAPRMAAEGGAPAAAAMGLRNAGGRVVAGQNGWQSIAGQVLGEFARGS
jgi:hypothetical protein